MNTPSQELPVILPLIKRHVRDAAFYWSQIDASRFSPIAGQEKLNHFRRQIHAHLDGLRVAGDAGWDAAYKNLARWKTQGEAFVCWLLALEANDDKRVEAVWQIAAQYPDTTLRGMIGALPWLARAQAVRFMSHWLNAPRPLLLEMALRGFAACRIVPDKDIASLFAHPDAEVRAACCQLVGKLRLQHYRPQIEGAQGDADARVREQAGLAHAWLQPQAANAGALHAALQWQLQYAPQRGLAAVLAQRRMELLARMLGHALPCGDARLRPWLEHLPTRLGILLLAHHGDPNQLPILLESLNDKAMARLAAWAIGMITGLEIAASELHETTLPEENEKPLSTITADADLGLAWPNAAAVATACRTLDLPAGPLLQGKPPTVALCQQILQDAPQILRFAAAWHLVWLEPTAPCIDTRGAEYQ